MLVLSLLATALAADPYLTTPDAFSAGQALRFDIDGPGPGARVHLAIGTRGPGPCVRNVLCLDVAPKVMLAAAHDGTSWSVHTSMPVATAGRELCAQVVMWEGGHLSKSNVECQTVALGGVWAAGLARNYFIPTVQGTHSAARMACGAKGLEPAVPRDGDANDELRALFDAYSVFRGSAIWLGLIDESTEGSFVDPHGRPATWFNWSAPAPDNAGDEDCVEQAPDGSWNDIACKAVRPFICETGTP